MKTFSIKAAIGLIPALLILFLPILCISVNRQDPGAQSKAMELYADGQYRRSLELLLPGKSSWDFLGAYTAARDYQEMRDFTNAVQCFETARLSTNKPPEDAAMLNEFLCCYYSQALLSAWKNTAGFTLSNFAPITNVVRALPRDSVFYQDVMGVCLLYQWKSSNYAALTNAGKDDPLQAAYRDLALVMTGRTAPRGPDLGKILENSDGSVPDSVYLDFMARLTNLPGLQSCIGGLNACQLDLLVNSALDCGMDDLAGKAVARHYALTGDKDYNVRNKNRLLYRAGDHGTAIQALRKFIAGGTASHKTIRLLLSFYYWAKDYASACALVKKYMPTSGWEYYGDYMKILDKLEHFAEMRDWFVSKAANEVFRAEYAQQVFRKLLPHSLDDAREIIKAVLKQGKNYGFEYYDGLVRLQEGSIREAYSNFLDITLHSPFNYNWLVSRRYEQSLRENYTNLYDRTLSDAVRSLTNKSERERLELALVLEDIDTNAFGRYFKPERVEKMRQDFTAGILKNVTAIPSDEAGKIEPFYRRTNGVLSCLNEEYVRYIEKRVDKNRYKAGFTLRNLAFYRQMRQVGLIVSRLNYYIDDGSSGRAIHPLLDIPVQMELYPMDYFGPVYGLVTNTNSALWLLSAFREESQFYKKDTSWAGAIGFTQLMPVTANLIKKNMRHDEWNVFDFADNLAIGAAHLDYLFRRYSGNPVYALCAYNAGEPAVNRWIKKVQFTNELWIECAEFEESRDYVKKIMLTRYFYRRLYGIR